MLEEGEKDEDVLYVGRDFLEWAFKHKRTDNTMIYQEDSVFWVVLLFISNFFCTDENLRIAEAKLRESCSLIQLSLPCIGGAE